MNLRGKQLRLERLKDPSCTKCRLHKSSQHVCILGKGNVMGPVFLVGEAPGAAEGLSGQVFCGRAGKFLDRLLHTLEMFHLVYITNAARCRPPMNRNPTMVELIACSYYLGKELAIIKPKVVILLGKTAMVAFDYPNISAGTKPFFDEELQMWINPTWHPSYCLRRGKGATNDLFKTLKWSKEMVT